MQAARSSGRWGSFLFSSLAVVGLASGGCAARTPVEAPTVAAQPLPQPEPLPYQLQVGDELSVKFWGNEELDQDLKIRPDGRISLPFIDEVQAAGLTPAMLDAQLTRLYTGELAKPNITVIVRDVAGQIVFVGGEVEEPGSVPLQGRLSLLQAIQETGGFLTTARRRQVLLIRTQPDGQRIARAVDLRPVLSGADPNADPLLRAFDIGSVPRTKITNINLFVEQYIRNISPVQPVFSYDLRSDRNE